jgi:hypothetical protein
MSARKIAGALSLLGALVMSTHTTPAQAAKLSLEGPWGGDQLQLVIDAKGGHIEAGCASGEIAGPIKLTADGSFVALGTFQVHQGGPQRADEVAATAPAARFRGEVKAGSMRLEVLPAGATAPEVFNLRAGTRIKLIRCL